MTAHLISFEGSADGIRFGDIRFEDGKQRHFTFDMLADTVRLNGTVRWAFASDPDRDPERVAEALKVLRRACVAQQGHVRSELSSSRDLARAISGVREPDHQREPEGSPK